MIKTQRYVRKPVIVDAVQVTEENFKQLAKWCQGEIQSDGTMKFIRVRVHTPKNPRQSQAFVGDWILYTDKGYKVYSNRAFTDSFDEYDMKQDNHDHL
jgi:hypothetical protein